MSINAVSLKCPECGADVIVEEGSEQAVCTQCGAQVPVKNDDAAGSVPDTSNAPAKRKRVNLKIPFFLTWLIASILVVFACLYLLAFVGGTNGLIGLVIVIISAGLPIVVGGGYVVFKLVPEMQAEAEE